MGVTSPKIPSYGAKYPATAPKAGTTNNAMIHVHVDHDSNFRTYMKYMGIQGQSYVEKTEDGFKFYYPMEDKTWGWSKNLGRTEDYK